MFKKIVCIPILIALLLGCSSKPEEEIVEEEPTNEMFSNRDFDTAIDDCIELDLEKENNIKIEQDGRYLIKGKVEEGSITVDANDVQIVLANVSLNNPNGPALSIKGKDAYITLKQYSYNHLNGKEGIISDGNVVLNGDGNLEMEVEDGINVNNLKITSGNYTISSQEKGISVIDNICIANGKLNVHSKDDSLYTKNGYFYMENGSCSIESESNGINALDSIQILGGYYEINTKQNGWISDNVFISSGTIKINAKEDGIVANKEVLIEDGKMELDCQNNGIHSLHSLVVNGGNMTIHANDGLVCDSLEMNGGIHSIESLQDGMIVKECSIHKGKTNIVAKETGLNVDSFIMEGGTIYIHANSILDYKEKATFQAGSMIGLGTTSKQMMNASVGCILIHLDSSKSNDTMVSILDNKDNPIESVTAQKEFNCVFICSSGIKSGKYSIVIGDEIIPIEMDGNIYEK